MERRRWSPEKDARLRKERGIGFSEIEKRLVEDGPLDVISHPNSKKYPHQKVFLVDVEGYVWMVPFVEDKDGVFLKTIFPSRRQTRKYYGGRRES